jgi:hypothetical protein
VRHADFAADGRYVHDPAAALRPHRGHSRKDGMQRPPEMDAHRVFEIARKHVLERADLYDSSVVDQDVQPTHARGRFIDETGRLVPYGDIAPDDVSVDAAGGKILPRAFELSAIARSERDVRALTPELPRHEKAQTTRPPGDEDALPAKIDPPRRSERTREEGGAGR